MWLKLCVHNIWFCLLLKFCEEQKFCEGTIYLGILTVDFHDYWTIHLFNQDYFISNFDVSINVDLKMAFLSKYNKQLFLANIILIN
jgi:hypothetical protein